MENNSKDIADLLLEWYRKGRENGTIPKPTEEDRKRGEELATRLIEWGRRQKEREKIKEIQVNSNKIKVKKKKLPRVMLEKEPVLELGRITYKNSGISVYLPRSVCKALGLNREKHSTFAIVGFGSDSLFLIKDTKTAELLKPMVLDMRRKLASVEQLKKDKS